MPAIVEREHRAAFASATEQVTSAMRSQPDRLATCIWRAMVALLTHFVTRAEPLHQTIARLQEENAAARQQIEALLAQQLADDAYGSSSDGEEGDGSVWEDGNGEIAVGEAEGAAERKASVAVVGVSNAEGVAVVTRRQSTFNAARRRGSTYPLQEDLRRRGSTYPVQEDLRRRGSTYPVQEDSRRRGSTYPVQEDPQVAELRQRLLEMQRDLLVERKSKEQAQQELKKERQRNHKIVMRSEFVTARLGAGAGGDFDDDGDSDAADDAEGSVSAQQQEGARLEHIKARGGRGRRSTLQNIEGDLLGRLEANLKSEQTRRKFLEKLRAMLIAALGEGYVTAVEQKLSRGEGVEADGGDADDGAHLHAAILGTRPPTMDAFTQFNEADSILAIELRAEENDDEEDDESVSEGVSEEGEGRRLRRPSRKPQPSVGGGKSARRVRVAVNMLNMRQIGWTIQHLYDDKLKRDAVDELEHRMKQPLSAFTPDFFLNRHGLREVAKRHLSNFREGVRSAAAGGNRRAYIFGLLAGDITLAGDAIRALSEPAALIFYSELERKAIRAAGSDSDRSDGSPIWLPIDRAIELLRNEFRYSRVTDISRYTLEVEELLRLPDEIHEISKKMHEVSTFVPASFSEASSAALDEMPVGNNDRILLEKPAEEQQRVSRRREEALVQNKVRAIRVPPG